MPRKDRKTRTDGCRRAAGSAPGEGRRAPGEGKGPRRPGEGAPGRQGRWRARGPPSPWGPGAGGRAAGSPLPRYLPVDVIKGC